MQRAGLFVRTALYGNQRKWYSRTRREEIEGRVHLAATLEQAASPDRGRLSVVISRSSPDPGIHAAKGEASFRGP